MGIFKLYVAAIDIFLIFFPMGFLNPIEWFAGLPHEWAVFFLSMLPVTELRAAVPIGLTVYDLGVPTTLFFSILGNLIPIAFILWLMPLLHDWVVEHRFFGSAFRHLLERAEHKFSGRYAKYGAIALVVFVGIPLPLTGAYTGCLASFVFKIPFRKAFPLIAAGVCMAAAIMTLITLSANGAVQWLS